MFHRPSGLFQVERVSTRARGLTAVAVHVDHCTIVATSPHLIEEFKAGL
jgi:hypothetical protein